MNKAIFILLLISSMFLSCNPVTSKQYINNNTAYNNIDITKFEFKINWKTLSQPLINKSIEEKKPVFIYFYNNSCFDCINMILGTFSYPPVVNKLNEDYLPVLINTADPENYEFRKSLVQNSEMPTVGVVFSDKIILHSGYISGKQMHAVLEELKPTTHSVKIRLYGTKVVELE